MLSKVGKDFPTENAGAAVTDIEGVTNEIKAYSKYNNSISSSNLKHEYYYNFGKKIEYLIQSMLIAIILLMVQMRFIELWIVNQRYLRTLHIN